MNFHLRTSETTGITRLAISRIVHGYGSGSTSIGRDAGNLTMSGVDNTANGAQVLLSNTTGFRNTADGNLALSSSSTGSSNTAIGALALTSNTTGTRNTAIGAVAFRTSSEGNYITASGYAALLASLQAVGIQPRGCTRSTATQRGTEIQLLALRLLSPT
jgi:hypothetical protein